MSPTTRVSYLRAVLTFLCMVGVASPALSDDANSREGIEEIVVEGEQPQPIGRTLVPPRDLPRSNQRLDASLIEEFNPQLIEEFVTLSSNVVFQGPVDGRESAFLIRGFGQAPVLRDGFRVQGFGGVAEPELFNLESVDVLKGTDSISYGESNPGGLLNLVSKRPKETSHLELAVELGSFRSVKPKVDVGGPLNSDGSLRYRLVALQSRDEGFRDYDAEFERLFIEPTLTWQISERAQLTFLAELADDENPADFGVAILPNGDLAIAPENITNHPNDTFDREQRSIGFDFDYELGSDWGHPGAHAVLRQRVREQRPAPAAGF